ncbi:MAG: ATP-binding protein [Neomegalonema sp.]|nr:ATP-binding protein [Neomegalonema sp.]
MSAHLTKPPAATSRDTRRTAIKDAIDLTTPAAVAAVAAAGVSGMFDASTASAIGVGVGAAAGAGVGALMRRKTSPLSLLAPRPSPPQPRQVGHEIIEFLPLALFVLDARGRVLFANAAATSDFGKDLVGRHYSLILRAPSLVEAVARASMAGAGGDAGKRPAVEPGDGAAEAAFTVHRRHERHMLAYVRAAPPALDLPWRTDAGLGPELRRASVLIMVQDVTRARRAERLHRDFVANASHELKTPLASIAGFVETLRGPAKDDPPAHERFLAIIAEQAERMTQLVDDLLSLNRIELNEHVRPRDNVDLREVIANAMRAATPDAAAAEGRPICELALEPDLPLARGDDRELTRAFVNLISNALKYGGDGRRPRVSSARRSGARALVGVTVEDFGPGIPKDHIPRLGERFYRVEGGTTRGKSGTGLGLAIVKHVVVRHRGLLEIDSEVGRGSRFTVWLPEAPIPPSNSV